MESLRERGFLVSMDDFGTGYSTMNMLKNQTLDEIKIDREFIRDLEKDKSLIIIRNTIAMLQQLGVHIVIEGVETEEQKEFLLGCNCTDVQGFYSTGRCRWRSSTNCFGSRNGSRIWQNRQRQNRQMRRPHSDGFLKLT